jgi:hypothetical protein
MTTDGLEKRTAAVLALAVGKTTDDAGKAAGVSGRTLRRWLAEDPGFAAEVRQRRDQLLDEVVGALTSASVRAVETLVAALEEDNPQYRIRAAVALLSALPNMRIEATVADEMAALEAAVKAQTEGNHR